jgi:hypothetical protein
MISIIFVSYWTWCTFLGCGDEDVFQCNDCCLDYGHNYKYMFHHQSQNLLWSKSEVTGRRYFFCSNVSSCMTIFAETHLMPNLQLKLPSMNQKKFLGSFPNKQLSLCFHEVEHFCYHFIIYTWWMMSRMLITIHQSMLLILVVEPLKKIIRDESELQR